MKRFYSIGIVLITCLFIVMAAGLAIAQSKPSMPQKSGEIHLTLDYCVSGATTKTNVFLPKHSFQAKLNQNGEAIIYYIPPGTYSLVFDFPKNTPYQLDNVQVLDNNITNLGIISVCRDLDQDTFTEDQDCNDNNPLVYPGATEECDGVDNNCDNFVDEDCQLCTDADNDGFYAEGGCMTIVDCDDTNQAISPIAEEQCDGIDNNCNGLIDEGISLAYDPNNCGECGNVCSYQNATAICVDGVCGLYECANSFADCDADPLSGCESNLENDDLNCGACGQECSSAANMLAHCQLGNCLYTCISPYSDCNSDPIDGCEVNTNTDVNHCGGCYQNCPDLLHTIASCAAGSCEYDCEVGWADCDGDLGICEADLTSTTNCGGCNIQCNSGETCVNGECVQGLLLLGEACSANSECDSTHCVDGVCCESICDGLCESCNVIGDVPGTCSPVEYGADPDNECFLGSCDGSGACADDGGCQFASECDDLNECTTDTCNAGVCDWLLAEVGTPCSEERICDGNGSCVNPCFDSDGDGYGNGIECIDVDCNDNNAAVHPGAEEICDGIDNNCDGQADESCSCVHGTVQACYSGSAQTQNVGECQDGSQTCTNGESGPCEGEVTPELEICDGLDNDCNGIPDDNCITHCTSDINCLFGYYCDSISGVCAIQKNQADTCNGDNECVTGNCVDGYCCNARCNGTCVACNFAGSEGICLAIPYGDDPDNECGENAFCNGSAGCFLDCPVGWFDCDGDMGICETNVTSDPQNCGDCGNNCPSGQPCVDGVCQGCPSGSFDCGQDGSCENLSSDPANCGGCGNVCASGQICLDSACVGCPADLTDCTAIGQGCVDTDTNFYNCGGCGNTCLEGQTCESASCTGCPSNLTDCTAIGQGCVDTDTDANNCGGCGNVCPSGYTCTSGSCDCSCPTAYVPVCGADGYTYGNACLADCAGTTVAHTGAC